MIKLNHKDETIISTRVKVFVPFIAKIDYISSFKNSTSWLWYKNYEYFLKE